MLWLQFVVCVLLVVVVGSLLSRYADILAEKTGLGRSWVGAVLLAGATSLPELATGISAVTVVGDVELATSGILGSCLFNLVLIAIFDVVTGPEPLLRRTEISHVMAASLGSSLLMIVVLTLLLRENVALPVVGWIGLASILIIVVYVVSIRLISFFELRRTTEVLAREAILFQYETIPLWRAVVVFGLLACAITALGLWLAVLGETIALQTGLGSSFVGAIFLAITTSLPEIVASIGAIRLGAVDLAVSNIFGSNIFNIAALAVYDLLYVRGDLWAELAPLNAFTAGTAVLMTTIVIVALVYQAERRPRWYVSWYALLLLGVYLGSMMVVYKVTAG